MKRVIHLLSIIILLLLPVCARAGTWSCYVDTARVTTPTPSGTQVQMTIYNSSNVSTGTLSGYFYLSGSQMVGWFSGSTTAAGTCTGVITGSNGAQYQTNPFTLTDNGNGSFNGPGWIHGEAFPNFFSGSATLTGNHIITGGLDIDGNYLTLGTHPLAPTDPGFRWDYVPNPNASIATLVNSTPFVYSGWSWKAGNNTVMNLSLGGLSVNVPMSASSFTLSNGFVVLSQHYTVPS